jgi:hypothetical protein
MPRGRPVAGRPRAGRVGWLRVRGRGLERAGADLVEARAAVHRPIVARRERDDRLAAARAADRGMELAWAFVGSGALGRCSTARAALRVVDQALAGIEGLLARREDELLGTIATGQRTVFVHPLQTLLGSDATMVETRPPADWIDGSEAPGRWATHPGRSGLGPGLIAEKIRAPSRPLVNVLRSEPHRTVRVSHPHCRKVPSSPCMPCHVDCNLPDTPSG